MLSLPENLPQQCFDAELLGNSEASWAAYREAIALAQELLINHFAAQSQPYRRDISRRSSCNFRQVQLFPKSWEKFATSVTHYC